MEKLKEKQEVEVLTTTYGDTFHAIKPRLFATGNFVGSPRNRFGTHSSYGFKGDYEKAWRIHFSRVKDTVRIRGTVRRCEMIAATMRPKCTLPKTESIGPRKGPRELKGDYPERPKDYRLSAWDKPKTARDREGIKLSCKDLAIIKRAALAEIKYRAAERERAKND